MENSDNTEKLIKAFCAAEQSAAETGEKLDKKILDAALSAHEQSKRKQPAHSQPKIRRLAMNSKATKLATAAVIAIAVIIGATLLPGGSVTFAQVIEPILNARTVVLDFVIGEGPDAPEMHDIVIGSGLRRTISNMPNMTMILDLEDGKMLTLDEATKGAIYVDIEGTVKEGTRNILDFVRNVVSEVKDNPNAQIQDLGKKEINGQKAVGFHVIDTNIDLTIWANADTALPIRIEFTEGKAFTIIKNIEFDVPLDESLVSMEVPAGYTLKDAALSMQNPSEDDFVQTLGFWAEHVNAGTFPDQLTTKAFMALTPKLTAAMQNLGMSEQEGMQVGLRFGRATVFFQMTQHTTPGTYAGKGVKLGDAKTPIFWYQPKGSSTCRVIYADLHIEDTAPADLPK